jgi:hypothetical protein
MRKPFALVEKGITQIVSESLMNRDMHHIAQCINFMVLSFRPSIQIKNLPSPLHANKPNGVLQSPRLFASGDRPKQAAEREQKGEQARRAG